MMWAAEIVLLLLTALIAVYFYFLRSYGYWKRKGVPHAPATFPIGSLKGVNRTSNIGGILKKFYLENKDEPFFGIYAFHEPVLLIRDPELIKEVLIKEFSTFHDRGLVLNTDREPLTNHLFLLQGQKWRNLRMKLTPTFTSGKMKMMFKTMLVSSEEMVSFLDKPAQLEKTIEVKDLFAKFTMNVIARCAFGLELDTFKNPNNKFKEVSSFLFKPGFYQSIKNVLFITIPNIMYYLPFRLIPTSASDFFINTVSETMTYRTNNNIKRNDFMQLLMELREKGKLEDDETDTTPSSGFESLVEPNSAKSKFTLHELAAQAFIFFVAGFETASTTLQFALFELARNPHVQHKLRKEIETVLAKRNGEVTYEAVQEIGYLDQVVSEILRKYPSAQFLVRVSEKEFQIPNSNLKIEKGQKIFISVLGLHMDPKYFPNPDEYDPERFSPENKSKIVPYSYVPFGDGPRQCIGMRFGLMQVKLGLLQFLKNYKVELCDASPSYPIQFDPKVFLTALSGGMYLKVSNL